MINSMPGFINDKKIQDFILSGIDEKAFVTKRDKFWESLSSTGTKLWLDTGDMQEAEQVWTNEMEALTTNNTLINNVIQKGLYDDFIPGTMDLVGALPLNEQVKEVAFIINARHGLRLVERFGVNVSVELHTDTAHDIDDIIKYGERYNNICPGNFIIKVPFTSSGLIGARVLKEKGIKINFTLGFSARQNVIIAHLARPDYLNVFLGRIGAYIINNQLGDGSGAGEKTVVETQRHINILSSKDGFNTRLIAASIRHHDQLDMLAGTDVFTIPPKVALSGRANLNGNFRTRINEDYIPGLKVDAVGTGIAKFWEVDDKLTGLAEINGKNMPASGYQLEEIFRDAGYEDVFPLLRGEEYDRIGEESKIPVFSSWEGKISNGKIAPDTLLNLAGLASFTQDQGRLDERIRKLIT